MRLHYMLGFNFDSMACKYVCGALYERFKMILFSVFMYIYVVWRADFEYVGLLVYNFALGWINCTVIASSNSKLFLCYFLYSQKSETHKINSSVWWDFLSFEVQLFLFVLFSRLCQLSKRKNNYAREKI